MQGPACDLQQGYCKLDDIVLESSKGLETLSNAIPVGNNQSIRSQIPRVGLVQLVNSQCAGASEGPVELSRPKNFFGISCARSPLSNSRLYEAPGIISKSHPCLDSAPSSPQSSQYLIKFRYTLVVSVQEYLLAMFWLRISSSLTTLSMIFLLFSSTTNIFHCNDFSACSLV